MPTKLLLSTSAACMAALGVAATFLPAEILAVAGGAGSPAAVLAVQIAGALYLGFAFLNWTMRSMTIGGIYGRPLVMANVLHFVVVSFALWKLVLNGQTQTLQVGAALVYAAFAVSFVIVMYVAPRPVERSG